MQERRWTQENYGYLFIGRVLRKREEKWKSSWDLIIQRNKDFAQAIEIQMERKYEIVILKSLPISNPPSSLGIVALSPSSLQSEVSLFL